MKDTNSYEVKRHRLLTIKALKCVCLFSCFPERIYAVITPPERLLACELSEPGAMDLKTLAKKTKEGCPSKWKDEGDATLTPGPEMVGRVHEALYK